jgi:hypothetical protein
MTADQPVLAPAKRPTPNTAAPEALRNRDADRAASQSGERA